MLCRIGGTEDYESQGPAADQRRDERIGNAGMSTSVLLVVVAIAGRPSDCLLYSPPAYHGGRPRKNYKQDRAAQRIRELREEGQSIREIADELGCAKSHVQRVCTILGCAPQTTAPTMMV